MASLDKNRASIDFNEEYSALNEVKKNTFSRLCNKLLGDNFIYGQKDEDYKDYYEVLSMRKLIENFFSLIDYDLIHKDIYKLFYIQTNADRNRLKLKKFETVIILILRFLYYKESLKASSTSDINIRLNELYSEVDKTAIFKRTTATDYKNALTLLRRYKIVNFNINDFSNGENTITIYPTILFVVNISNLEMLNNKIESYKNINEEDDNYEADED